MRAALGVAIGVVSLIMTAPTLPGQRIESGTDVRLWSTRPHLDARTGTLVEASSRTLSVLLDVAEPPVRLEDRDIVRLQARLPRSRAAGAARGLGLGMIAGAAVGGAAGLMVMMADECSGECYSALAVVFGVPMGALLGGPIGAVLGATNPGASWQCVPGWPCGNPRRTGDFGAAGVHLQAKRPGFRIRF